MAGAVAAYNSVSFDYVNWSESYDPVIESGAVTQYNRTFRFSAWVRYANYSAYSTGMSGIIAGLSKPAQTLTITDPSSNSLRSFGATDVIDDGPTVTFSFRDHEAYGFWIDVSVTGGVAPAGTGAIADTYTEKYDYSDQESCVYTKSGTYRSSTAFATITAALDTVDVKPSGNWEFNGRDGTLDEDKKVLTYSVSYRSYFEALPTGFVNFTYNLQQGRDGRQNRVTLTAQGGVSMDNPSAIESMAKNLEAWAKGKMPKNSKISEITPVEEKREGRCSITITGIAPVDSDVIESSETRTTTKNADYVIRKRAGGGGAWIVDLGDDDETIEVSGYKVGLNSYPAVNVFGRSQSTSRTDPIKGPDGEFLYRVDYRYSTPIIGGGGQGGQAVAGAGGAAGGGGGAASSGAPSGTGGGFGVNNGSTGGLWGNQSGFSTGGLVSGAAGGISGTRSGFATFG